MNTLVSPTHAEKLPAGSVPPVAGVLLEFASAARPAVLADVVSEQVMAAHAKSKVATNRLWLVFIDFRWFWVLVFASMRHLFLTADKCVSAG
jgi:hypothetical protein